MAASRCMPSTSPAVRRQLNAFSCAVLLFLAGCRASESRAEYSLMQLDNRHGPWRNLKSMAAHAENFHSKSASFGKSSRWGASSETSITSRRRAASNDGLNATSRLEVEALIAFKAAIISDPLGVLKSWHSNSSDVCGWAGVVCSPKYPKAVIALNLGDRQLVGHLNSALQELGSLSSLRRLDLSNNVFNGSMTGTTLANCSNLSYLNISYNDLTGSIPFLLGELVNLEVLDFKGNNLSGEIPATLGNCSSLTVLDLGSNLLTGEVPSVFGRLSRLEFLNLAARLQDSPDPFGLYSLPHSHSSFFGSIPLALGNCSSLKYVNMSYNDLTGSIPFLLGELVNLEVLDFKGNNLSGEIPATLGNCSSLTVLDLGSNLLKGEVPLVFGRLSRLEFLNLAAKLQDLPFPLSFLTPVPDSLNSLSGSIPPTLGNCSSLKNLNVLYNSNLGGELPFELMSLKSLRQLQLSACKFQGVVPTWLGNLTSLSWLRLAYNEFVGDIPDVLGRLGDLDRLSLGGNNLTGVIPISIMNCTRLTVLSLERNGLLTGHIPSQVGLLKNLGSLIVRENEFTGVIPTGLANCSALTDLDLSWNPLMDSQMIPSWIGSLPNLLYFYLIAMNLQGEIPKELGRLSNLQFLSFSQNNLTGTIPSSLANCTSLVLLECNINKLTGEIPSQIGLLMNLVYIDFSDSFLIGSLPASLANLTQVQSLRVSSNSLNGTIDIDFGRLSQLTKLHAEDNYFTGPIPKGLSNCSNLFEVDFSRNRLTEEIPASLGNLTRLEQLLLGNNNIIGKVPENILRCFKLGLLDLEFNNLEGNILVNIGQLSSLRVLRLAHNHFTGAVPNSLGNLSDMNVLDLSFNLFIGNVRGDVFLQLSSLTSLNLAHNNFSGLLLDPLSQLPNIQAIDISANSISGSIPSNIGRWKAVVKLDISMNNLTGVIPPSLGLLPALAFFNASYNNFQGPIPDSGVFKANVTNASFLGNPNLCGIILGPHRECLAASTTSATSHRSCGGFSCKQVWIPATCGGAGLVFIVLAVGLCWVRTLNEATKRNSTRHMMLNFRPLVRFSETDVLRTIDGDGSGDNIVAVGSRGTVVYGGVLPTGEMFALKVLRSSHPDHEHVENCHSGDNELLREVQVLAKLRHRRILKVLGVCFTSNVRAIILEYMPQGSLHNHLYPQERDNCELTWLTRFNIAFGIAEGMMYLHHEFPEPLIHRDLKPSNILLDANLNPKVGDFGISKFVNPSEEGQASASTVCGTIGYMPPEYATSIDISTKGDVYAYGIVLLELLTRKSPTSSAEEFGSTRNLRGWVMENFQESPMELLDSTLQHECTATRDSIKQEQMLLLIRLAIFCTADLPQSRPSMSDVLVMLTQIKEVGLLPVAPRTIEELAADNTI